MNIKDCIENFLAQESKINKQQIVYVGGSHGGFLGAHLISRSNFFRAAALRNPGKTTSIKSIKSNQINQNQSNQSNQTNLPSIQIKKWNYLNKSNQI